MSNANVIVLCYYFLGDVGGRRWTKFSKILKEREYDISIFACKSIDDGKFNFWKQDQLNLDKVFTIPDHYPKIIKKVPASLIEKILYRFAILYLKLVQKGNIYDPSCTMEREIKTQLKKYILDNNVKNLIVTGYPYAYAYYACQLKEEIPSLNIIIDYRDLWTQSKYAYGSLIKKYQSEDRYNYEIKKEKYVLEKADHIVAVSRDISESLYRINKNVEKKTSIIPNGLDLEEDILTGKPSKNFSFDKVKGKIIISYFGTINCGAVMYDSFFKELIRLKKSDKALFDIIQISFYGNKDISFKNYIKSLNLPNVQLKERISLSEMKNIAEVTDFFLYFKREDELENSFATKFYDYVKLRKPIILFSPKGDVTEFIKENSLGYVLSTLYDTGFTELMEKYVNKSLVFNSNFDLKKISVQHYVDEIERLLVK